MVASSEAVECYVCTSALNETCGDDAFNAAAAETVDCGDTVTGCLKGKVDKLGNYTIIEWGSRLAFEKCDNLGLLRGKK